jgi:chemotaxis-related protein WspB
MHVLMFHLDGERYGLDTGCIRRVLPLLELKRLAQAPKYVAGLMNYHGTSVPVIDLSLLTGGAGCEACFDTRIVVVEYKAANGCGHALGLIAERVIGTRKIRDDAFADSGVRCPSGPYLGQVVAQEDGILQLIQLDHLLPEEVRAMLFQTGGGTSPC